MPWAPWPRACRSRVRPPPRSVVRFGVAQRIVRLYESSDVFALIAGGLQLRSPSEGISSAVSALRLRTIAGFGRPFEAPEPLWIEPSGPVGLTRGELVRPIEALDRRLSGSFQACCVS